MKKKGRILVNTGDGKGKSTAAFGLALRAVGHGKKVIIIQFLKERTDVGEVVAARRLAPLLVVKPMGTGFVFGPGKPGWDEAVTGAREALEESRRALEGGYDLVILDEIFGAVNAGVINEKDVTSLLERRDSGVHIMMTGRKAPESVISLADTVTEMCSKSHAYETGRKADKGIEY